jgi:alpha-1,3-glucosyltransferase
MLLGVLIWMLSLFRQGHDLLAGVMFAILLNMKHLFAYLAPVITIYLWQHYCHINSSFSFRRFLLLGFSVSLVHHTIDPMIDKIYQLSSC